jgi:uncharacterized protein (TIGR03118 family)
MVTNWSFNRSPNPSRPGLRLMLSLLAIALLSLPAAAQKVNVTYLTSDITNAATNLDPNLADSWGMSISPTSPRWVSDRKTGLATLYDGNGVPQSLVVTIPPASGSGTGSPTGTVYNPTSDFMIHMQTTPFLFCTLDGTISGWYTGTTAFIAVNNNSSGAIYTGMALASAGGANYIYVANINAGAIEAYDGSYHPHSFGSNAFMDTSLPTGYTPFNIQLVGSNLLVSYAKQNSSRTFVVPGPGNGYVDVYDTSGNLLLRMQHNLYMNAPWGLVQAPASFSGLSNDLLIGQFGSGAITAYNLTTGAWIGNVLDVNDLAFKIDGLWALGFGNGSGGGPTSTLYFTAGPFKGNHGIFGSMTPHTGP